MMLGGVPVLYGSTKCLFGLNNYHDDNGNGKNIVRA
jgi:hypothetical protein